MLMPSLLVQDNVALLRSAVELLKSLEAAFYAQKQVGDKTSGIGPHIRHVLDHYQCLVGGIGYGFIDYDHRERDDGVESDPQLAIVMIDRLIEQLLSLEYAPTTQLSVRMDCGNNNNSNNEGICQSTLGREFQFLVSHTVHHYAIIAIYCAMHGVEIPPGFGVAPSTLKHQSHSASC
jgi:hypothetical protein